MEGLSTSTDSSPLAENQSKTGNQRTPTSVMDLRIDVNSPPVEYDSQDPSPADSKSKRSRRRRKPKARGNQIEPVSSPQRNYHINNNKGSYNNNNNSNNSLDQTTFRPAIIGWRSSKPRSSHHNSNSTRYNTNNNISNQNRNNNNKNKDWKHPSPRFNKYMKSPACPASVGFPTSKKQHDAPMKKRDLYFALHVERVGIALAPGNESNDSSPSHQQKAVARVTLTNFESEIVLDTFVVIPVPVTDFFETGIRPEHVQANASPPATPTSGATDAGTVTAADTQEASRSFSAVRARVERMLRGKILIGYDLEEGLKSLGLSHPTTDMRECSSYFPTLSSSSLEALEELSRAELNRWSVKASKARVAKDIPSNEAVVFANNDPSISRKPVLVCVTTMDLYKKHRNEWETALIARGRERERQQQEHLLKVSQQRKLEQHQTQHQLPRFGEGSSLLSIHCESVRTGISGVNKTLARVTIVDGRSRNILMDDFCQIPLPVTDFCDTGITPFDIQVPSPMSASSAKPLSVIRAHVEQFLRGSLLVGYKVEEDLKALGISHPWTQIRDTAFFPPFLHTRTVGGSTSVVTVRSPDELSAEFLGQPLRPMGDRARPVDLCQSTLGLYDTFRVQ